MPYNKLTPQEEDIIEGKGTEAAFSGEYDQFFEDGGVVGEKLLLSCYGSRFKGIIRTYDSGEKI